jgi:hypothetical protein
VTRSPASLISSFSSSRLGGGRHILGALQVALRSRLFGLDLRRPLRNDGRIGSCLERRTTTGEPLLAVGWRLLAAFDFCSQQMVAVDGCRSAYGRRVARGLRSTARCRPARFCHCAL